MQNKLSNISQIAAANVDKQPVVLSTGKQRLEVTVGPGAYRNTESTKGLNNPK